MFSKLFDRGRARQTEQAQTAPEGPELFVPPGHYYSPITDKAEAGAFFDRFTKQGIPESLPGIDMSRSSLEGIWKQLAPLMNDMKFPEEPGSGDYRYRAINDFFGFGDALMFSGMIQLFKPKRIIEVGCGWSSACAVDTIDKKLNGQCKLTFIEPHPERLQDAVGLMPSYASVIAAPIQDVPLERFDALDKNDILFIDSTHIVKTGSDVCHEVFNVMPRLKPGVIVHFHDIFWPFEYPRYWAVDQGRSWNELYLLRALLMNSTQWKILMFNNYFGQVAADLIQKTEPRFMKNIGGSLWLQRA